MTWLPRRFATTRAAKRDEIGGQCGMPWLGLTVALVGLVGLVFILAALVIGAP